MSAPRPDLLAALPDIVAARIRVDLPALRECRGMVGRFDVATLKRVGLAAPAVLVSRLGARQSDVLAGPHTLFEVEMAAFVVTKDTLGLARDEAAANICQVLLRLIPEKTWGQDECGAAQRVREQSLITETSEAQAASLWAVTWMQPVALSPINVSVPQPISLYVGQEPMVGQANAGAYTQMGATP